MRITLCLSARCTLTYAPFGSPTSSLQGSPHYRLRPAATLRSLTGLPLYWDVSSPERRTAQWRARPAERRADGRLRSQPSQARAAAPGGEQRDCPPPNPIRGSPLHPNPFPFRLPFPPFQAAPVHDGGLRRRALRAKGGDNGLGNRPPCLGKDSPPLGSYSRRCAHCSKRQSPPMQMPLLCPMLHASLLHSLPLFQQRLLPSLPHFFPGLSRAGPCVSFSEYKQV